MNKALLDTDILSEILKGKNTTVIQKAKEECHKNNMILERVQTIVNEISKEFYRRFGEKAILIWFGSWVKGTAYQQSDIDLAIEHHGRLTPKEIVAFRDWLDDFPTLYSIDLVELEKANALLKQEIERDGKKL